MPQYALKAAGLTKSFNQIKAVDGLNLEIPEGVIFGLLGPNGAGKTTTLRMLSGLAKPNSGKIELLGKNVKFGSGNEGVLGYLPDVPQFYPYMTAKEFLVLCGQMSGLTANDAAKQAKELLELVSLNTKSKKVGGFSRGMKQRLGLAQALMGNPKILLMDEPVSALDPVGRAEVLNIIEKLKGKMTIIFSTHILSDAERVCEYAAIIKEGKIVLNGKLTDIKENYASNRYHLKLTDNNSVNTIIEKLSSIKDLIDVAKAEDEITFITSVNFNTTQIVKVLAECDAGLISFNKDEPSLEDIFLKVVGI